MARSIRGGLILSTPKNLSRGRHRQRHRSAIQQILYQSCLTKQYQTPPKHTLNDHILAPLPKRPSWPSHQAAWPYLRNLPLPSNCKPPSNPESGTPSPSGPPCTSPSPTPGAVLPRPTKGTGLQEPWPTSSPLPILQMAQGKQDKGRAGPAWMPRTWKSSCCR